MVDNTKRCRKCGTVKTFDNFYKQTDSKDGLRSKCKECERKYYQERKDHYKQLSTKYHQEHKEHDASVKRKYYQNNKHKINQYTKTYYRQNKAKILANQRAYFRSRLRDDINFKIACSLRTRLSCAIRNNQKKGSAVDDLGCSISELKTYLESKFLPGMTWENYGRILGHQCWEIDHIKPLSLFDLTDRDQLLIACHYTNLQPLWAVDNNRKNNQYLETESLVD